MNFNMGMMNMNNVGMNMQPMYGNNIFMGNNFGINNMGVNINLYDCFEYDRNIHLMTGDNAIVL